MSAHQPVTTKAELDALDEAEIVEGYRDYRTDDPEPGANHSRAYWHGWRNAAIDHKRIPIDAASHALAREMVAARREERILQAARAPIIDEPMSAKAMMKTIMVNALPAAAKR